MKLYTSMLEQMHACGEQYTLFKAIFGDGAEVTPETIARALEARLNFDWAAEHLFNEDQKAAYNKRARRLFWEAAEVERAAQAAYLAAHEALVIKYETDRAKLFTAIVEGQTCQI